MSRPSDVAQDLSNRSRETPRWISPAMIDVLVGRRPVDSVAAQADVVSVTAPGYTSQRYKIRPKQATGVAPAFCSKVFHVPEFDEARLREVVRREQAGLAIVHNGFRAHPEFGVPRPVYASPAQHLLVMEYIEGTNFGEIITRESSKVRGLRDRARVLQLFSAAGRLLGEMQRLSFTVVRTPNGKTRAIEQYYRDLFSTRLDQCQELGGDMRFLARIGTELDAGLRAVFERDIEVTYQHHDFRPQNFIVGDRLYLVDFMLFGHGSPYFDVAAFVSWVRYQHAWHPGWTRTVHAMEQAFLEGYVKTRPAGRPFDSRRLDVFLRLLFPWNYRFPLWAARHEPRLGPLSGLWMRYQYRAMRRRLATPVSAT